MRHDDWTDRLSEYVDDEMGGPERAALEAHLAECPACVATVAELRTVVAEAASLGPIPPERDLWDGINARLTPRVHEAPAPSPDVLPIQRRRVPRQVVMTLPQLIAAAIALVLFSAGGVWMTLTGQPPAAGAAGDPVAGTAAGASGAVVPAAYSPAYDAAVSELEAEFQRRRTELDPETIRVVERNLAIIDDAIADARAALERDPSSGFLNAHLAEAMRRKVELLRQAAAIERNEI